jgi:prepilin-type N-terminal cleavage/methylation domain-containing protein
MCKEPGLVLGDLFEVFARIIIVFTILREVKMGYLKQGVSLQEKQRLFPASLSAGIPSAAGFTLIELVVVIAIIGILATIVGPNAFKAIEKAKISRMITDVKTLQTASMDYYADIGIWPPDVCPKEDPGFEQSDAYTNRCCGQNYDYLPANYAAIIQSNWNGPYMDKFPRFTPWAGSYDWEYWPGGGWTLPPGMYVSVRPAYGSSFQCGDAGCGQYANPDLTAVPDRFEIKLQQMGYDKYISAGVNTADHHVITEIMKY